MKQFLLMICVMTPGCSGQPDPAVAFNEQAVAMEAERALATSGYDDARARDAAANAAQAARDFPEDGN